MNVLVVYCHPNPGSFVAATRDAAVEGLHKGGHEVRVVDLYERGFQPELTAAERAHHRDRNDERSGESGGPDESVDSAAVTEYIEDLQWAEALVFVYPTWWGSQPAMLKGWFDRVWVEGVAWELPEGASVLRPRLTNIRRILIITTHGSSRWINRLQGEPGKRVLTRSIRLMCSRRTRTRWCAFYNMDTSSAQRRREFLDQVEHIAEVIE